jgi:hypothetical protein
VRFLKSPPRLILLLICLCVGLLMSPGEPEATGDCLICHGKAGQSADTGDGVKKPPHVDETVLRASAHSELGCVDCHGEVFRQVPHTSDAGPVGCGGCHPKIFAEYEGSVHGAASRQGVQDAPGCTGCHGAHAMLPSDNPTSTVFAGNVPASCSKCHAEERITREYGLATRRLETYENSFHGIANRFGEAVVANCASCHGIHTILPSSDPASSIAPANLASTCGKCHVGAGENFAKGKVHVEATRESSKGMFYVRRFYTWLIAILMLLFILHITMDIVGHRRKKRLDEGHR